ncbi:MAG: regulatory protein RecX [Wujia sp.]
MKNRKETSKSAFDTALSYLTFKDRSKQEVRKRLYDKGYEQEEIDMAIEQLVQYGYLDDNRYVRNFIDYQSQNKGKRRIMMELQQKGISKELATPIFDSMDHDEVETIASILQKRYRNLDDKDEQQLRSVYNYFARRGFSYDGIRKAIWIYRKNIENM